MFDTRYGRGAAREGIRSHEQNISAALTDAESRIQVIQEAEASSLTSTDQERSAKLQQLYLARWNLDNNLPNAEWYEDDETRQQLVNELTTAQKNINDLIKKLGGSVTADDEISAQQIETETDEDYFRRIANHDSEFNREITWWINNGYTFNHDAENAFNRQDVWRGGSDYLKFRTKKYFWTNETANLNKTHRSSPYMHLYFKDLTESPVDAEGLQMWDKHIAYIKYLVGQLEQSQSQ